MSTGKGGIQFGNIGGTVNMNAGGDIVGGDKTTTKYSSPSMKTGFQKEEDKVEFMGQLEEIRSMMRELKSMIGETETIDEDDKDELIMEAIVHVKALKKAKEEAAGIDPGQEPPESKMKTVDSCFEKVAEFITRVDEIGQKTADFAEGLAPIASRVLPLLAGARHLFGLP